MALSAFEILIRDLINEVESSLERITPSSEQPIASFPSDGANNYLYVLYSTNGMPLRAGIVAGSVGKRETNRLQQEVQKLSASGFVSSFRTLDLGSERVARLVGQWFSALFGSALHLSGLTPPADVQEEPAVEEKPATTGSRRGRRKAGGRRGRPRKSQGLQEVQAAPVQPKRRGRPRKVEASESVAEPARKRRGRKPRSVSVTTEAATETPAPKKRGRKPRVVEAVEATPKRRGRRPKSEQAVEATPAPARRRGGRKRRARAMTAA